MDNIKSIIVTCIFSLMFMTLTFCFYRIAEPAFIIIVSILSAYGFVRTIFDFNKLNYDIEYYYATEGEYPIKIYVSLKFLELLIFQDSLDMNIIKELKYHNIPVEIDYNKEEYYYCLVSNEFKINEIE